MTPPKTKPARTSPPKPEAWAGTADDWRKRSIHRAELPSGMRIEFRRPTLGYLITSGSLPEQLRRVAAEEYAQPGATAHAIAAELRKIPDQPTPEQEAEAFAAAEQIGEQLAALTRELCAAALINPQVTADDLADDDFPVDDLEMLAGFVTGLEHLDAAGRCVGAMPLDELGRFCHHPDGPEGCGTCQKERRALSTTDLGAM